jgi:hypothetical protein
MTLLQYQKIAASAYRPPRNDNCLKNVIANLFSRTDNKLLLAMATAQKVSLRAKRSNLLKI